MRLSHRPLAALALVAAVACTPKDAPKGGDSSAPAATSASAASSGDEDLADVASYRLTMDKVDQFLAAQRNLALRMKDMSPEEREAIKARAEGDTNDDDSLKDMERKIASEPALAGAVRDAGLSPREYTLLTVSMMQSAMAAGVLKMRPKDNQDSLVKEMKANPDNVRFIQQNEAELQRKQQALADELKRMGVPTDG